MIEIAGGITDPAAFKTFCASPNADAICKSPPEFPTLVEDFNRLSQNDRAFQSALQHAQDSYRDPRVRAVFAMAPALGPAFRTASLTKITIPVKIVAGQAVANVPIASSAKYFADDCAGHRAGFRTCHRRAWNRSRRSDHAPAPTRWKIPPPYMPQHRCYLIPRAQLTILPGGVGHYVFLDSCTDVGRQSRAMLCSDGAGVDRDKIH